MSVTDQILKFFGEVILYGGGSATVAFLIFQALGKGWLNAKFSERLEAFKHEQAKELQALRVEVESLLSGALKIQEREFTVLPEAWLKLNDAYSTTSWLVSPLQQYPDISQMEDDELEEFLSSSELLKTQQNKVIYSVRLERNKIYQEIIFWHRLNRAKKAVGELGKYIVSHGIFLPPPLKQQFSEINTLLNESIIDLEVGHEAKNLKMQSESWKTLKSKGEPLYRVIENSLEQRLHSHAAAKKA